MSAKSNMVNIYEVLDIVSKEISNLKCDLDGADMTVDETLDEAETSILMAIHTLAGDVKKLEAQSCR